MQGLYKTEDYRGLVFASRHLAWLKAREAKDYIYADQIRAGLIALGLFNPKLNHSEGI